jgi:tight adherence protein B
MAGLIAVLTFISILLLSYQLARAVLIRQDSILRLARYINTDEPRTAKKSGKRKEARNTLGIVSKGIGNAKFLEGYKRKVQLKLTRAHLLLKAEEFISLSLILFIISAILIVLIKGMDSWPLAIIFGIVCWFIPSIVLNQKIKKRVRFLNDQLGDAITLISNSLKAGYSFFQAVDMVAREMNGPIAEEFSLLQKEINLGVTCEKALENLSSRVSSDDLGLLVTAVTIQRQVGGNLAEVLDNISTTIRDRVRIKAEIKTVTAQGRMSGWVISLLPAGIGALIYLINPSQMSLLFTRPLGILILVVSVFMELIGIFFISRIVKIEI